MTSWNANSQTATASWQNVFTTDHPLYYEVSVRLEDGDGDIVQWQETTDRDIDIELKTEKIPETGATLEFSVRAINHAGYFETVSAHLFVPGSM